MSASQWLAILLARSNTSTGTSEKPGGLACGFHSTQGIGAGRPLGTAPLGGRRLISGAQSESFHGELGHELGTNMVRSAFEFLEFLLYFNFLRSTIHPYSV